jgi:hypothetical protein
VLDGIWYQFEKEKDHCGKVCKIFLKENGSLKDGTNLAWWEVRKDHGFPSFSLLHLMGHTAINSSVFLHGWGLELEEGVMSTLTKCPSLFEEEL